MGKSESTQQAIIEVKSHMNHTVSKETLHVNQAILQYEMEVFYFALFESDLSIHQLFQD